MRVIFLSAAFFDPALIGDFFGAWEIRDASGKKRCRIVLKKEQAIGGYAIEIAENCEKSFPVIDEIAGWRLLESWTIDLIDVTRKTRIRFSTPDNNYIAIPEVDGIARPLKPPKRK
ncbi:MAG: protease inhibitor Inh/omp19 family protein [Xanthobacteraceae bacterium]|nr:protease inhibitor Inh/omp19 family protein [Xanthobacteraceae bacterium]